jgi:hypothetical protein
MRRLSRAGALGMIAIAGFALTPSAAAASGQALVIGDASYSALPPLPGCAVSAHAMAAALRRLGFSVDEQDDASSGTLYAAIDAMVRHMAAAPPAPAVVYLCGYVMGYNNRPFLLPIDANVTQPSDVLAQGILFKSLLTAVVNGKPSTGILAVDAVPLPKATTPLRLDALEVPALPPMLGYIAVAVNAAGSTPLPLATTMVPMMKAPPPLQGAALLTEARQQLSGMKDVDVAALVLPDANLYLAGAPPAVAAAPPAAATAPPAVAAAPPAAATAPPAAVAAPPAAAAAPPAAASAPPLAATHAALSLPDESEMTIDQGRLVQRALSHLGYYDGKPDGIFGPDTRAAIRRWQYEEHQPMTGHLTAGEASKLAATWD